MDDQKMPIDECYDRLANRLSDHQRLMHIWLNRIKTKAQNQTAQEFKSWVWSDLRPEMQHFHDDLQRQVMALRGVEDE